MNPISYESDGQHMLVNEFNDHNSPVSIKESEIFNSLIRDKDHGLLGKVVRQGSKDGGKFWLSRDGDPVEYERGELLHGERFESEQFPGLIFIGE